MKKFSFWLPLAAGMLTLASCNEKLSVDIQTPDDQKEMISFSMTDASGATSGLSTKAGFTATTRIVMRMRSKDASTNYRYTRTIAQANAEASGKKYSEVLFDGSNKRYWDDAYGRDANISVFALAIPNKSDASLLSEDKLTNAAASSNYVNGTPWFTEATENETFTWAVSTDQSNATNANTIPNEDITYSNNIQPNPNTSPKPNGYDGVYSYDFSNDAYTPVLANDISNLADLGDGVMKFQLKDNGQPTGVGKFNKGHLIFNHALTRLTIHIRKGTGVVAENAFAFSTGGQVQVLNVPVSGTFDIETGKWTASTPGTITKMANATNKDITENVHNFMAQFVPGYTFVDGVTNTNVMQFTIDDNTYYVTQDMIYDALFADNANKVADRGYTAANGGTPGQFEMKQGKNYDLTITVGKKQIETITATLVDWVYVEGTMADGDNSYVTLSLLDAITGKNCKHFDIYRLDAGFNQIYTDQNGVTLPELYNWNGNYTDKATTLTETTTGTESNVGIWKTNWYWESNKAFYHLRTIDKEMVIQGTADNAVNDYINVYSGPINDTWATGQNSVAVNDLKYNDYHWGAPMKSTATALTYQTTGSDNALAYGPYIHSAIGSTHSTINMIEQHMMANIHIILHTGKKADGTAVEGGKITLKDGSNKAVRVTLTNFVGNGIVELGRGLVNANGTLISSDIPVPGLTPAYTSNVLNSITGATDANYYKTQSTEEDVTLSYDYRVVPQSLYRGSDAANETDMTKFIGLTLVSPDNNQYYMVKKLYDVTASAVTTNHGKIEQTVGSQITRWFPGYDYTYHIYLNKKDIEAITCTVVDWVTVTGANKDINLED